MCTVTTISIALDARLSSVMRFVLAEMYFSESMTLIPNEMGSSSSISLYLHWFIQPGGGAAAESVQCRYTSIAFRFDICSLSSLTVCMMALARGKDKIKFTYSATCAIVHTSGTNLIRIIANLIYCFYRDTTIKWLGNCRWENAGTHAEILYHKSQRIFLSKGEQQQKSNWTCTISLHKHPL